VEAASITTSSSAFDELTRGALEHVACPLCLGENRERVFEGVALHGNDLILVACRRCGHLFLDPRPSIDAYMAFYRGDSYMRLSSEIGFRSVEESMAQFDDSGYWADRFQYGQRLYDTYLIGELGPSETVFDFGCGDGAWLWALRELTGCEVAGQEVADVAGEVVRTKLGIELFLGALEEVGAEIRNKHRGNVKLAIVSGSLQHMPDPVGCLRLARELLTPDGRLYVCNWSIFEHYMARYAGPREQGSSQRLLAEVLSWEHLHYFHESSFRFMLENAGFEILALQIDSQIRPRHMEAFARRSERVGEATPTSVAEDVVARIRALESAAVAARIRRSA